MKRKIILVTGGAGYIGSHTIVELIQAGYEVISVDNFLNSDPKVFTEIEKITGRKIKNYSIDLSDSSQLFSKLLISKPIYAVIHFAAKKSVPESIKEPLLYYENNIQSLINILEFCKINNISRFIFSSSCSVYGDVKKSPVLEGFPLGKTISPYGETKQIGERILKDFSKSVIKFKSYALRYFNPAGAHPSLLIGDNSVGVNQGVVSILTKAILNRKTFPILGNTYSTKDGTAMRDYVHVSDIALAHVLAIKNISSLKENFGVLNLGAGRGVTVLDLIKAFEKYINKKIFYKILPNRIGDIPKLYASNIKAKKEIGWTPKFSLKDIIETSYNWENKKND